MSNEWIPAERVEEFSPLRHDFRWNEDYSMFQAIPLKWWDEASYIAYQAGDFDPPDDDEEAPISDSRIRLTWALAQKEQDDDDVPF